MRGAATALSAALAAAAAPLGAQVGYDPPESPFRDLEYRQELTAFGGYFDPAADVAGVAPQGGPMLGLRYELRIGGPAHLYARLARASSERRLLDASAADRSARITGTSARGIYLADAGISLNLTGQKSWHGLIPVVSGGVGIAADPEGEADRQTDSTQRGFKFGTPFALSFGGGVRWVPGGRFQLRADVTDYLYQVKYPASYFTAPTGLTPLLGPEVKQNQWKNNLALTLGASVLLFR